MTINYRQVFEDALKEDRYNSTVRLIYADWLEENGFDDEAVEQRRRAKPEWIDADKWMHDFASRGGQYCSNYGSEEDDWRDITYEDLIQAGYDYIKTGDHFVQMGSETLRSLMYEEGQTWWKSWSIITGEELSEDLESGKTIYRSAPFSCSC